MSSVSVIIPNYNRAELLERAVLSAWNQSHRPLEIIISDDCSTDNSRDVFLKHKNEIPLIWLDAGKNGRPAIPRNLAVKMAKGDWLAFLDNDDSWEFEKLKLQLHFASEKNASFVCCNAIRKTEGQADISYFKISDSIFNFKDLLKYNPVICSSVLVKKSLVIEAALFPVEEELKAFEDYALWLKIASRYPIHYFNKTLVNYTDSPKTSIRNDNVSEFTKRNYLLNFLSEWLKSEKINGELEKAVSKQLRSDRMKENYPLYAKIIKRLKIYF